MSEFWTLETNRRAPPLRIGDMASQPATGLTVPISASELVTLHDGPVGTLLLARCASTDRKSTPTGYIENPHFVFPLSGSYVWHAGGEDVFADTNRVLWFAGREQYATSHPVSGDVSMAIMPSASTIEQLCRAGTGDLHRQLFGTRRSWPASHQLQLLSRQIAHEALDGAPVLAIEELTLQLLDLAAAGASAARDNAPVNRRAVIRAKEYIHTHGHYKLTLGEVADAVGLNPVYLSQMFTKAEAMPLYRYMRKMRLATTLNGLRTCDDITALALDNGFSSHSHFTSAFATAFHQTPSAVRQMFNRRRDSRRSQLQVRSLCTARGGGAPAAFRAASEPARQVAL